MAEARMRLIPGPGHPITIEPNPKRVIVRVGSVVVADTTRSLTLREARYPAATYVPRDDVVMSQLSRSPTKSYCPYKGEASYFGIPAGGSISDDAVWTYEEPYESVAAIKGYLAFYGDRVSTVEERDA